VDLKAQSTLCELAGSDVYKKLRLTDFEIKTIFRFLKASIRDHS